MTTQSCIDWTKNHLTKHEVEGKRVIEIGAYDVNGGVRSVIEALKPNEYIGIDMRPGPDVDVVCPAEKLVERFGANRFDLVISSCTFEHVRYWQEALSNMKNICKPNGLILFIVPSRWPFHAYPNDFWRYAAEDVANIFVDFECLLLEEIAEIKPTHTLVFAKFKKPAKFVEKDLSSYGLYSIVTDKRQFTIRRQDFYSGYFAKIATIYLFNRSNIPRPIKYAIIYVVMGIKLKLINPLLRYRYSKSSTG